MRTKVVNIRLTPDLIAWLDSQVDHKIYKSRSEIVRTFLRDYLKK